MLIQNGDALALAGQAHEALEIMAGETPGGAPKWLRRAERRAFGTVVKTRATSLAGLRWKIGQVVASAADWDSEAAALLQEAVTVLDAGGNAGPVLLRAAAQLGPCGYSDLILSAAVDMEALAAAGHDARDPMPRLGPIEVFGGVPSADLATACGTSDT